MHRGLFFLEFSEPQSQGLTLQLHLTSSHYLLGKMLIQMIDATSNAKNHSFRLKVHRLHNLHAIYYDKQM